MTVGRIGHIAPTASCASDTAHAGRLRSRAGHRSSLSGPHLDAEAMTSLSRPETTFGQFHGGRVSRRTGTAKRCWRPLSS
jgi:hypothetical protein